MFGWLLALWFLPSSFHLMRLSSSHSNNLKGMSQFEQALAPSMR